MYSEVPYFRKEFCLFACSGFCFCLIGFIFFFHNVFLLETAVPKKCSVHL